MSGQTLIKIVVARDNLAGSYYVAKRGRVFCFFAHNPKNTLFAYLIKSIFMTNLVVPIMSVRRVNYCAEVVRSPETGSSTAL